MGNLDQGEGDLGQIDGRNAAITGQQTMDARAGDHLPGEVHVQGRKGQAAIHDHFGGRAAVAEEQHRPELGIHVHAHDQLMGMGTLDHGLDAEPQGAHVLDGLAEMLAHSIRALAHGLAGGQVEGHAAGIGLVHDDAGKDFQYDRPPHFGGDAGRFIGIVGGHGGDHGNAIGGQHGLGLGFQQPVASLVEGRGDDAFHRVPLRREGFGHTRRHFHEHGLTVPVAHHLHESPDRLGGRLVAGDALFVEHPPGRLGRPFADPATQKTASAGVARALFDGFQNRLGGIRARTDGRGAVHHQYGIHARVLHDGGKGVDIALGRGIADDVHGVAVGPGGRQHRVEFLQGGFGKSRQGAFFIFQGIGGHDPDAAAVGQERQTVAGDRLQLPQGGDCVEQRLEVVDAQDSRPLEGRLVNRVAAGHGAGVGGGRHGAFPIAAGLDHDDRLDAGRRAGRGHELARMGDRFDVEQDGARMVVGTQVVQHVAEIDIGHVAQGDQMGKADAPVGGPVDHRGEQGAGLGHEGQSAGQGLHVDEAGVEIDPRQH
ncbi:hypothetical protein DESC_740191 [Desulfosarcina cetonica]|nr:hypothetical protein DESC_740191 [Desulfosarcina cetonica]